MSANELPVEDEIEIVEIDETEGETAAVDEGEETETEGEDDAEGDDAEEGDAEEDGEAEGEEEAETEDA